jgi:hypothetical protein
MHGRIGDRELLLRVASATRKQYYHTQSTKLTQDKKMQSVS